ncbi:MAG TPA: alpha/beta hydrolase [Blastocatellia bacterium]|jgi:pimeloyl-ACP methyl ester carboxylesterase
MIKGLGATCHQEEPFLINKNSEWLYGVAYVPAAIRASRRCCVLLNPLDNEANNSIRFYVRMARLLAARGVLTLRFDYRGTGNSSCCFSEVSLNTLIDDVKAIQSFAARTYSRSSTALAGARFGATLALIYAGHEENVADLILWDPILDPAREFKTKFVNKTLLDQKMMKDATGHDGRSIAGRLEEDGVAELSCMSFSRTFYKQFESLSLEQFLPKGIKGGLLILPDAPLSSNAGRVMDILRGPRSLQVRRLSVKRSHPGWGAEDFSESSEMASALQEETLAYVAAQSPAEPCEIQA